jgi:hypothetical protein
VIRMGNMTQLCGPALIYLYENTKFGTFEIKLPLFLNYGLNFKLSCEGIFFLMGDSALLLNFQL